MIRLYIQIQYILIVGHKIIVINPNDFLPSLELSQQQLLNGIGVWLSKGSGWAIDVYEHVYVYEMLCMNQQRDHIIYHYQWSYRIQAGVWLT